MLMLGASFTCHDIQIFATVVIGVQLGGERLVIHALTKHVLFVSFVCSVLGFSSFSVSIINIAVARVLFAKSAKNRAESKTSSRKDRLDNPAFIIIIMWNSSITSAPSYYGHQAQAQLPSTSTLLQPPANAAAAAVAAASSSGQKHDIFVGNLAFATTEEQLYAAFSELGRIVKIRMVSDLETGKPRGFAFVEFEDPQAALSAIRNMNDYEINGRKLRVNFSNSSHLETLANQLGMDLSHVSGNKSKGGDAEDSNVASSVGAGGMMGSAGGGRGGHAMAGGGEGMMTTGGGVAGSKAVASALKSMNKGEMYDVVAKLKEIADTNPDEARKLLTQHPQLPEAILYCMSELDMIKTPVGSTSLGMGVSTLVPPTLAPPSLTTIAKPIDPRSQFSPAMHPPPLPGLVAQAQQQPPPPIMAMPSDPRARPADPRAAAAAARDPRAVAVAGGVPPPNFPAPPPMMQHPPPSMPPPSMGIAPPQQQQHQQAGSIVSPGVAGLDPNLVQQVMALTPAQIAQLPPDKQQSILALRQQITGGVLR